MPHKPESRRRTFIRTSALAAGALTLPRFSVAQPGPSSSRKIGVAVVGAGGMGGYAVEQAAKERFVALCDVDDQRAWTAFEKHPEETLYHADMRPESPMITPNARFMEIKSELRKIEKLPPVGDGPIEEWLRAIKGEGPMPGSNFDYAAPLTEVVLLGALAQRTGRTIEWDAQAMQVKGQPELESLIKEPAREGWQYGQNLG